MCSISLSIVGMFSCQEGYVQLFLLAKRGTDKQFSFFQSQGATNVIETQALGRHAYFRARKLARIGEVF